MFLFCQARLLKVAGLADGLTWSGIAEVGILAGWDFTVALFIAGLSFGHENIRPRKGFGSRSSLSLGYTWLFLSSLRTER